MLPSIIVLHKVHECLRKLRYIVIGDFSGSNLPLTMSTFVAKRSVKHDCSTPGTVNRTSRSTMARRTEYTCTCVVSARYKHINE